MAEHISLAIIGGGPAGMAAAVAAYDSGLNDLTVFERDDELGGILNQCIHNGFGLHTFKEELTGPEYAGRFIEQVKERGINYQTGSMVLSISPEKEITVVSKAKGLQIIQADAIILAMGCRERPRGALNIPGMRPQGIYTAGTAQKLVNCEGVRIGKEVVMGIRPENIDDSEEALAKFPTATVDVDVEVTELMGSETYLYLKTTGKDENIIARVDPHTASRAGDTVSVAFDLSALHFFDKDTEQSIMI